MNRIEYKGVMYDCIIPPKSIQELITGVWYFTNKWGKYVEVINWQMNYTLDKMYFDEKN